MFWPSSLHGNTVRHSQSMSGRWVRSLLEVTRGERRSFAFMRLGRRLLSPTQKTSYKRSGTKLKLAGLRSGRSDHVMAVLSL